MSGLETVDELLYLGTDGRNRKEIMNQTKLTFNTKRAPRVNHINNTEVLRKTGVRQSLLDTIKKKSTSIGHMRHPMNSSKLEDLVERKNCRGRPGLDYTG